MEYLNSSQVTKEIKKYLESSFFQYAIMINGPWGCGKSYLVNKHLKQEIEKTENPNDKNKRNYKYLYISLYGLKEIAEVENMIATQLVFLGQLSKGKSFGVVKDVAGIGLKVIPKVLKQFKFPDLITDLKEGIPQLINDIKDLKQYVFVFDDFERTAIPLNEILGFVSNLIEIDEAKVIIVTNEDEIKDIRDVKSDYQKYFWYLLIKDKINIPQNPSDPLVHTRNSGVPEKKPDFDAIMCETELLFKSKTEYKITKEKVIGKTLNYQQDESEIEIFIEEEIERWNKSGKDSVDKKVSLGNLSAFIAQHFKQKNCYNLRAVQRLLSYLFMVTPQIQEVIFEKFEDGGEDVSAGRVFKKIIANIIDILIDNVKGIKYEESMRAPKLEWEFDNSNRKRDFRFAADYFYFGVFDEAKLKKDLVPFVELQWMSKHDPDNPLYKLSQFSLLEESKVLEIIEQVKQGIDSGRIGIGKYGEALFYITILERILVIGHGDVEKIIEKMVVKIEDSKISNLESNDGYVSASSEEDRDKYEGYLNILQKAADKNSKNPPIKSVIEESLGKGLLCSDEVREFYMFETSSDATSYFLLADVKKLTQVIKSAKAKDVLELRKIVQSISECVIRFPESGKSIKEFYDELKKMKDNEKKFHDKIAAYQIDVLIQELEKTLEQYKPYERDEGK